MASPRDWSDFNWFVDEYVPRQTIPILKKFAAHIEIRTRLSVNLRAGDKKADIVEKISNAFRVLKTRNALDDYLAIRLNCEQEGIGVPYRPPGYGASHIPNPTFGGVTARNMSNGHSGMGSGYGNGGYAGGSSTGYRPQPAAGPSRNGWQTQTNTPTAYSSRAPHLQDWKPNPMWKPIRALTNMEMLPDIGPSESSHTRRERKVHITLTPDIVEKLNYSTSHPHAHPQYSVRLFCASSDYYRPPNAPLSPANGMIVNKAIPIEYPNNPDVYVDEYGLPFKERGLRGKAGSAPPFDLDKGAKGLPKVAGRMTSVSMAHTGATVGKKKDVSKRFWFQVVYCEITSSTELQNRIDRMIPAGAQESLKLLRKKQDDDDDIVFGQSRMSLKDPLSYMRLARPVRSTRCTHLQCFEAKWWISGNEKHPQWLCPLCNHELRFDELIVDGYTLEILATVPDEYDEVVIEADNAWHTEDGKYGSPAWLASHASGNANGATGEINKEPQAPTSAPEQEDRKPSEFRLSSSPDPKGKRKAIEILSSDDEEEQPLSKASCRPPPPTRTVSRQSAPVLPSRPPSTRPQSAAPSAVIDLTLSDSEDSAPEDPYFDRPNERRTHGAGSGSVPPVKPLGDRSAVRSSYTPTYTYNPAGPASDGRLARGDSYRPGPSNANHYPSGDPSNPPLYSASGGHYQNSHARERGSLMTHHPSQSHRLTRPRLPYPRVSRSEDEDTVDEDGYSSELFDNRPTRTDVPLTSLPRAGLPLTTTTSSDQSRSPRKQARGRVYSPDKSRPFPNQVREHDAGSSLSDLFGNDQVPRTCGPSIGDLFPDERRADAQAGPSGVSANQAQRTDGPSIDDLFPDERNGVAPAGPTQHRVHDSPLVGQMPYELYAATASAPSSPTTNEGPSLRDLFADDDPLRAASANRLVSTLEDLFRDEPNALASASNHSGSEAIPEMPKSADDEVAVNHLL